MTKLFAVGILGALLLAQANALTSPPPAAAATATIATNAPAVAPCKTLQRAMDGKQQHLVAYGTSLTWAGSWVEKLRWALCCQKAKSMFTICNAGFNSKTSGWGVSKLAERVLKRNPDAVLIEFAINDAAEITKISVAQCRTNLETMVDRIRQSNPECEVILMTMNLPEPGSVHAERRPHLEDYYQVYRDVAKSRGLLLVDMYPTWKKLYENDPATFKKYVPDGLHPGPLGDEKIIVPAIVRAMGL